MNRKMNIEALLEYLMEYDYLVSQHKSPKGDLMEVVVVDASKLAEAVEAEEAWAMKYLEGVGTPTPHVRRLEFFNLPYEVKCMRHMTVDEPYVSGQTPKYERKLLEAASKLLGVKLAWTGSKRDRARTYHPDGVSEDGDVIVEVKCYHGRMYRG